MEKFVIMYLFASAFQTSTLFFYLFLLFAGALLSLLPTLSMQRLYSLTSCFILFVACLIATNVVAYFHCSIWLLLLFLSSLSHVDIHILVLQAVFLYVSKIILET